MLNEMIVGRMKCPVCGRYIFGNLKLYWCPFCGSNAEEDYVIISDSDKRLTKRDEDGIAMYTGVHSLHSAQYAQFMNADAVSDVLERLCKMEEEKENENLHSED